MADMIETEFHSEFPKELRNPTLRVLRGILPLLEGEISTLRVALMDEEGPPGSVAAVQTHRQYHLATLWLSGAFFLYSKRKQRSILVHEAGHILLDGFTKEAYRIVEHFVEDEATKKHLVETLGELEDRVVETLALAWPKGGRYA